MHARTGFLRIQIMMAADPRLRKELVQHREELMQRELLLGRAVIFVGRYQRRRIVAMSALRADADAVRVISLHVATLYVQWPGVVESAVATNIEVITRI